MNEEVFNRVKKFISEETHYKEEFISPTTTLLDDIGLVGDDALEFFEAFFTEFNGIDAREFNISKYFPREGGGCLFTFLWLILLRIKGTVTEPLISITIEDLVKVVEYHKWTEKLEFPIQYSYD